MERKVRIETNAKERKSEDWNQCYGKRKVRIETNAMERKSEYWNQCYGKKKWGLKPMLWKEKVRIETNAMERKSEDWNQCYGKKREDWNQCYGKKKWGLKPYHCYGLVFMLRIETNASGKKLMSLWCSVGCHLITLWFSLTMLNHVNYSQWCWMSDLSWIKVKEFHWFLTMVWLYRVSNNNHKRQRWILFSTYASGSSCSIFLRHRIKYFPQKRMTPVKSM